MASTVGPRLEAAQAAQRRIMARRSPSVERWIARAVAAVAAILAVGAPAEPVGLDIADAFFAAVFAGGLSLVATRARRSMWLVSTGVAFAATDGAPWTLVAAAGLALAFLCAVFEWRPRVAGAAVGAVVALGVLHQPADRGPGLSTLAFLAASLPVLLSGLRHAPTRTRRRIVAGGGVVAVLGLAAVGLFTLAMLESRATVDRGLEQARTGLAAAREGDTDEAAQRLGQAAEAFASAESSMSAWWLQPTQVVPGIRQQVVAIEEMARDGAAIATAASGVLADGGANLLSFEEGQIDLARLAALGPPLDTLIGELSRSTGRLGTVRSPWLLAPVSDRLAELDTRVSDAHDSAVLAADAVRVMPALLGGEGPKRYFVAFVTPVETRGRTGFMGNFGVITVADGRLELSEFTRTEDFERILARQREELPPPITAPADYASRYNRFGPATILRNIQMSPDFPSVAQVLEEVYLRAGGAPVDGVLSFDPWALSALLAFTGPIAVEGLPERLTADTALEFLVRGQYVAFEGDRNGRTELLEEAARLTFEKLNRLQITGPRELARVLGPVVEGGHLVAYSNDPEAQRVFERVGIDGGLPAIRGDFLGVVSSNAAGNKIDLFLQRDIAYVAAVDPVAGTVDATVTVTLHNGAPAEGLPDYIIGNNVDKVSITGEKLPLGYSSTFLSIYSPLQLVTARVDGTEQQMQAELERDRWVYSGFFNIPPGGSVTVELQLAGLITGSPEYRLDVVHQPLVNPDTLHVELDVAGRSDDLVASGLELDRGTAVADVVLDRGFTFAVTAD